MNFLSISVDDLISYQAFKNHFGGQLHTPNIDRLMESGTNFDNAFSQVAKCNPSRTSILSGQRPEETGVHDNNVVWHQNVPVSDTLPYILAINGFDTDVIGKVYHKPADELPGAAKLPFDASTDKSLWQAAPGPFKTGAISQPEEEHGDYINTSTAIEAIENWQPGEQNAVFLGIFRPHGPFSAPQEYFDLYPLDEIELPETMENDLDDVPEFMQGLVVDWYHQKILTADYWKEVLQSYFACVSFADAQVGRVLDALEATGMDEETLVMLWSDHGYHLGDKEHWHKFTLWEESARAPLVIRDPRSDVSGRNVETPVELLDIMPTALDLLGVTPPKELAGKSLRDFIEAESYPQEGTAYTTMYGSLSIRTNTHRLTIYEDDSVELYDLVADPNQFTNLAGIAAQAELQQNLTEQLFEHAEANGWLRAYGSVDLSNETTGKLVVFPTGDATVLGGQGDDTYFLRQIGETIIEAANGGRDRVYFRDDLTLPENIEDAIAIERTAAKFSTVHGNELDNLINGATNIFGYAGNDWLGLGDAGTADGGAGDDELRGSNLADTLLGGDGNDFLFGRNGDDVLRPGKGNDKVQGTGGVDTVDYRDLTTAVYVDLANQTATSENKTDILLTVEAVAGTDLNDVILGDAHNNIFYFWSGYDQIDGAEGTDIAQLEFAFADVEWIAPSGETGVIIKRAGSLLAVLNAHNIETFAFTDDQVYTVAELLASDKAIAAPPFDAVDDQFDFAPGGDLLLDVLSNDELPVGDYSIAIVSQGAYGLAQVFDDEIRYLRNPDGPAFFPGDSFTYEIKTSDGLRDVAMVTIAAEETGNQPPVIAPLGDLEVTETDEVTVPISASDTDGNDTVTLSALIIRPNGIPVNPDTYALSDFGDGTGELVWKTPSRADDGVYDIIITAQDGVTPAVTEQFTITVRDTSAAMPVIEPLPDLTVDEKDEVVVPISASDADGNDTITLSALIIRPNGQPVKSEAYTLTDFGDGTGELVWKTPTRAEDGVYDIIITAEDGVTPAVTEQFNITVIDTDLPPPDPDQKLLGTRFDDDLIGGSGDDTILLRFGNDSATGNDGADQFIIDGRYLWQGDTHEITDLDFSQGDQLVLRAMSGGNHVITNQSALEAFIAQEDVTAEPTSQGMLLSFSSQDGVPVNLLLHGDQPPEEPDPTDPPLKLLGSRADDTLAGGNGDDTLMLRFGNDSATGNDGADQFILDGRYLWQGDAHEITDLDFSEGDQLVLRKLPGVPIISTKLTSMNALERAIANSDITATQTEIGLELLLQDDSGDQATLLLRGFQLDDLA